MRGKLGGGGGRRRGQDELVGEEGRASDDEMTGREVGRRNEVKS